MTDKPRAGTTTGVWIREEDVELFERFDEYFQAHGPDPYKRSSHIRRAMEIYLLVHSIIRQDPDFEHPENLTMRELRGIVNNEMKYDER